MSLYTRVLAEGDWQERDHPRDNAGKFSVVSGTATGAVPEGYGVVVDDALAPIAERASKVLSELNARFGNLVRYLKLSGLADAADVLGHKSKGTIYLNRVVLDPAFWEKRVPEWTGLQVDPSLEGVIAHEYGHVFFRAAFNNNPDRYNKEVWPISNDISSATTSPYGMENGSESEAEAFSAVFFGKTASGGAFAATQKAHAEKLVAAGRAVLEGPHAEPAGAIKRKRRKAGA